MGALARALEEADGLLGLPLGHVHDAEVVERLDVVGLDLQRLAEVRRRLVVALVVEVEHALRDVDVGLGRLRRCGEGNGGHKDGHCQDQGSDPAHAVLYSAPGRKRKETIG